MQINFLFYLIKFIFYLILIILNFSLKIQFKDLFKFILIFYHIFKSVCNDQVIFILF